MPDSLDRGEDARAIRPCVRPEARVRREGAPAGLGASLIAAVTVGDTAAPHAAPHVEAATLCRTVRVSGGDDNGMTGGVREAHLTVKNTGGTACAVAGRPWLRIPRLPHPITVTDAIDYPFAGTLSGRVLLKPGGRASALIWLNPGRCTRGAAVTFGLAARAGWRTRSVPVANEMCIDGTGLIDPWVVGCR